MNKNEQNRVVAWRLAAYHQLRLADPHVRESEEGLAHSYALLFVTRPELNSLLWHVVAEMSANRLRQSSAPVNQRGSWVG